MNDIKNRTCEFEESIVSYLYNELSQAERGRFEKHLLDCAACTDEFAAVAASRFEVYEWTKEFAQIPTPRFVIQYARPVPLVEKIRRAFQFNWGSSTASAAFAAMAVLIGLVYFAMMPDRGDIAGVEPLDEKAAGVELPIVVAPLPGNTVAVEATAESAAPKRKVQPTRVKTARPAGKHGPARPQQTRFASNDRRTLSSPRLTEFADDPDDSLRLAELFADVESSE